jgi:hypothetical protein
MQRTAFRRPVAVWWWSVLGTAVVAAALALTHFPAYLAGPNQEPTDPHVLADSLYRTLQLFVLSWETQPRPAPWPLHVARLLAAGVALSTALAALLQLFRERVALLLLRRYRDHVLLCGLGDRGVELVHDLRKQRQRVVVLDRPDHPDLPACRALGAAVLPGTADRHALVRARVDRAATLLSLFQDDAATISTALLARDLNARRRQGPLRCIVQVNDLDLRRLLERRAIAPPGGPVRLEFFNLFDLGAQVMLRECPAVFQQGELRRLLVVGLGWLGQMLVLRLVRGWHVDRLAHRQGLAPGRADGGPGRAGDALEVIVVDRSCREYPARLTAQGVDLPVGCFVTPAEMDVEGEEFLAGKYLSNRDGANAVDAAFVCLTEERLALLTAARLRERFGPGLPVVMRMNSAGGAAELLTIGGAGVHVIGLHDLAATLPLITQAEVEMIAREIHRDYVLDQFAQGHTVQTNPVLVPWHLLDAGLQESNRQAAAHVDAKLRAVGCEKHPARLVQTLFTFTPEEVDRLSRLEHERWCEERRRGGWRYGPVKDVAKKVSPALVAFDALPEEVREANRARSVRRIPVWLAKAGYAIRRLPT